MRFRSEASDDSKVKRRIEGGISGALRRARFPLRSEAIIFEKALQDLMNEEPDIKRLAVCELGRIGHKAVTPVLKDALSFRDPQLKAEIINSLIQLEDSEVFEICKRYFSNDYPPIRTACIRGLYKAGREKAIPLLTSGLQDPNIEVRNSSAMFLGWLEASTAVPSLLQATRDLDRRVRANAILSLANIREEASVLPLIRLLDDENKDIREKILHALERITGETVTFKSDGTKPERSKSIENLKDWWLKKRHGIEEGKEVHSKSPLTKVKRGKAKRVQMSEPI